MSGRALSLTFAPFFAKAVAAAWMAACTESSTSALGAVVSTPMRSLRTSAFGFCSVIFTPRALNSSG